MGFHDGVPDRAGGGVVSGVLPIVRRVVASELAGRRTSALGVVTATFPHTDANDSHNYEVNVALKYEDLELRRVPIAAPHIGAAAPPRAGDLVLVTFVDGDLNQPVVLGRLYDDGSRPPLHQDDEILFEQRLPDGTLNHIRLAADGSIVIQRDVTKPADNSEARTSIRIDGASGDLEIAAGPSIVITLTHDAEIRIKADGKPIAVDCDALTVTGNVEVRGDLVVTDGGTRTTISGNTITGG
jgi:phage baseplate assembly protein gpV